MSSLRLALKQSLQENPQLSSSRRRRRKNDVKIKPHSTITLRHEAPGSSGLSSSSSSSGSSSSSSSSSSGSSSSSSSDSDSSSDEAEREAKELFDADLSSDDSNKSEGRHKKESAANTIQNHWKKKKAPSKKTEENKALPSQLQIKRNSSGGSNSNPTRPNKTVPPPTPRTLNHIRSLSTKRQRSIITTGLRVKVRFVKKGSVQGRITRKLKWYGGKISHVSSSGKRVRIKYDDGTDEVAEFPDKDIVVDDEENGVHDGDADGWRCDNDEGEKLMDSPQKEVESDGNNSADDGEKSEHRSKKKGKRKKKYRSKDPLDSDHSVQREKMDKGDDTELTRRPSADSVKVADSKLDGVTEDLDIDTMEQNERRDANTFEKDQTAGASPVAPRKSPLLDKSPLTNKETAVAALPSLPLEENKALSSSSSSGSTCSRASFAGVANADDHKEKAENGEVSKPADEIKPKLESEKVEKKDPESVAPSTTPVKKHRPLSIKISLPKRKRPEEEGKAIAAHDNKEPVKKKVKNVDDEGEMKVDASEMHIEASKEKKLDTSELFADVKPSNNDDSDSDGEIKEEKDAKASRKLAESEDPPKKKPKLSIHISKKKIKAAEEAAAENSKAFSVKIAKPMPSPNAADTENAQSANETEAKSFKVEKKHDAVEKTAQSQAAPTDKADTAAAKKEEPPVEKPTSDDAPVEKITDSDKPKEMPVEEKQLPQLEPAVENESNPPTTEKPDESNEKKPPTEASPGDDDDDRQMYSLERSGRKAAKEAAEKLKGKKNKRREKSDKITIKAAEEDPWVQCDRCHKWRHLPATVNLDSLPEHWFCELNTYDDKRNNCDAPEQTPKEVVKEKKRAKKLALKKLHLEQAEKGEYDGKEGDEGVSKRKRSTSPDPNDDKEYENAGGESPKAVKPKRKPGRPRNEDRLKAKEEKSDNADDKKQEWVQCEKCEKWRRLPPRIKAEDLPDVWFCSMNTWDINLATCTAIEDKIEPKTVETFNVQSQIPLSSGSSGKLSYRNLIFGNGRQKRSVSERMRAQESLFSTQNEADGDMSIPTVMYASSDAFSSGKHKPTDDDEGGEIKPSIFDTLAHSRIWNELNNGLTDIEDQNKAAYDSVGYPRYCNPDGSLKADTIDTLKTMVYFALTNKVLANHELLLEIQCRHWKYVPRIWLELRAICTIEIVNYVLDLLMREGLVQELQDSSPDKSVDEFYYRITPDPDQDELESSEVIDQKSTCLKIRKPWR